MLEWDVVHRTPWQAAGEGGTVSAQAAKAARRAAIEWQRNRPIDAPSGAEVSSWWAVELAADERRSETDGSRSRAHVKLRRIGNSLGVILPKAALERVDLREGDVFEIEILHDERERRRRAMWAGLGLLKRVPRSPGAGPERSVMEDLTACKEEEMASEAKRLALFDGLLGGDDE